MPRNDEIVRPPPPRPKAFAGAPIKPLSRLRNEVDRLGEVDDKMTLIPGAGEGS